MEEVIGLITIINIDNPKYKKNEIVCENAFISLDSLKPNCSIIAVASSKDIVYISNILGLTSSMIQTKYGRYKYILKKEIIKIS